MLRTALCLLIGLALGLYALSSIGSRTFGLESPTQLLQLPSSARTIARGQATAPGSGYLTREAEWWLPGAQNWQQDEILRLLGQARNTLGLHSAEVAFVPSVDFFHEGAYSLAVSRSDASLSFVTARWSLRRTDTEPVVAGADLVVWKTGQAWPDRLVFVRHEEFARALGDPATDLGQRFARQFLEFARRPLPDNSEAVLYVRRGLLARFNALRELPAARISAGQPGFVAIRGVMLNGDSRATLFAHPPLGSGATAVQYSVPTIPSDASLEFGIAMTPDSWGAQGDGVEFTVELIDGLERKEIFRQYLDPKHNQHDRRWIDVRIDLDPYAGRSIELRFTTRSGPNGDNTTDWAVWSEPLILPIDAARLEAISR